MYSPPQQQSSHSAPRSAFPPPNLGFSPGWTPPEPTPRERIERIKSLSFRALRYWKLSSFILVVGCAISLVAAMKTKLIYRSECIVQFKAGMHMNDRNDDESPSEKAAKLAPKLKEKLTTHARLERVIKEFNLYPQIVDARGPQEAADEMREKHIGFRGRDSETFVISFQNESPELAQKVTQRLADTMIDEYTKGNLEDSTRQMDFFAQQEEASETRLEAANKSFAKFLAAHPEFAAEMRKNGAVVGVGASGTTPVIPQTAPGRETPLAALERQRDRLAAELHAVQSGTTLPAAAVGTPAQEAKLVQLKQALGDAQKQVEVANANMLEKRSQGLADAHPDMIAAKQLVERSRTQLIAAQAEVRQLEGDIASSANPYAALPAASADEIQKKLNDVNNQIAVVSNRPVTAPAAAGSAAEPVSEVVELETDWQRLLRNLQDAKAENDDLKQKLERSRLEAARTHASGGDSMSILDPAYLPMKPAQGGRTKTAMMGGFVSALLALLYAFGRVVFNDKMIDAADIEALKLLPVLGVLPKIQTSGNSGGRSPGTTSIVQGSGDG